MKAAENPLLKPFIGKPAVLDSNLLLLQWCASFDRELVRNFKRLNCFEIEDIELLSETLRLFSTVRTTPHVLTEVSNLANSLPKWMKEDWSEHFSQQIQVVPEEWTSAATIATGDFMWLGLTDAALAALASTHVIVTIDFPLSNSLESRGLNVLNFTHLRNL
jgi:rRNA maturation endonuclease Nob1